MDTSVTSCLNMPESMPEVTESRRGRKHLRMEQNWKKKIGKDRGDAYFT